MDLVARLETSLTGALARAGDSVPWAELRAAAETLTRDYRTDGRSAPGASSRARSVAYGVTRMPATLAAVRAALRELRRCGPGLRLETLLDVGAGPGTALWAASLELNGVQRARLVEPDPAMVALGCELADTTGLSGRVDIRWDAALGTDPSPADLVVSSYLLTELEAPAAEAAVERLWSACGRALVLVLPGTPAAYRLMLAVRERLLAADARIVAPCPHAGTCPLEVGDWCHFAARVGRSRLHRRLKGGRLAYEDEKLVYLVATRGHGEPAAARVIRRPRYGRGQVGLELCTRDGLRRQTVPRSAREVYRAARRAAWGDVWTPAT